MQQILSNYKKIDLFGQEIRLLAKGEQTHRTFAGATMTLNQGKNANLNSKVAVIGDYEGYSFNSSDFKFAVGIVDFNGQQIPNENNRIFYISYYQCIKTLQETTCNPIPSGICGDRIKKLSAEINIPEYYQNFTFCMDEKMTQTNGTLRLQGSFRSPEFMQVSAVIFKCVNTTEFQGCAPQEEIDSYFLKNTNVYYSYTSHQFNKELEGSPYQIIQAVDITPLYNRVRKYIKIYYQYSQSILDYNPFYFFQKTTTYDGVEYEKIVVDTAVDFVYDNSVAQIEIYLDSNKILRYISYQTLMDVTAKLGGFFSIIRLVFSIFITPFSQVIYHIYLINSLLKVQSHHRGSESSNRKIKLSFTQLLCSIDARQIYNAKINTIKQLLDISEVLINPVKLANQVEDLYNSMKRSDDGGGKVTHSNNIEKQLIIAEDQIFHLDSKVSSQRSINQEVRSEKKPVRVFMT